MITLDRLVNVLGGYGVVARLGAVPRTAELRRVVIPEPGVTGDVVLAIGADSPAQALGWARDAGAVAAIVRIDVPDDVDDVAVLTVDPAVPWSELAAVVYGLVLEGRETESGRGPTDLFALADSLAAAIGAAVVIEGRRAQVLAYSQLGDDADEARVQTILARRAPDDVRESLERRGVFAHLNASDEPLFVPPDPASGSVGRMVVAARVGRELLGSVWVITPTELRGPALAALRDGARTVALHLLRSRASADLERQVESEAVLRLLDGAADAVTVASRLGLAGGPLRVIALRARLQSEPHTALLVVFERATSGFGWSRPGRTALAGNTVYTVLPCDDADAARRWVGALRDGLPRGTAVVAGISGPAGAGSWHPRAGKPTSAWRCTSWTPTPSRRPTTSPGTTCCCSGCARSPVRAAGRRAVRSRNSGATTRPTERRMSRHCGPGWRRRATRCAQERRLVCTRTPCAIDSARWPSSARWTSPTAANGWP